MNIFIQLQGKKVIGWGSTKGSENDIEVEVADDHEVIKNPFIFTYDNGEFKKDVVYQQQLIQEQQEQENKPSTEQQLSLMQQAIDDIILGVL